MVLIDDATFVRASELRAGDMMVTDDDVGVYIEKVVNHGNYVEVVLDNGMVDDLPPWQTYSVIRA